MRPFRFLRRHARKLTLCFALSFTLISTGSRVLAVDPVMTGRATMKINAVGTLDARLGLQTKTMYYTALKQYSTNFRLLARSIGMNGKSWIDQQDLNGQFRDSDNEIELTFQTPGAARAERGDRWVYSLNESNKYQLVSSAGNKVTLMGVEETEIGIGTVIMDIEVPEGSTNIEFDERENEISYDFTPQMEAGDSPDMEFEVDHKDVLMSCLAKCYGNEDFSNMWAARSVFRNTGDQTLNNLRVRFRVAELGSWSGWKRTSHVYPGQTVVDPFFPIFDLDRVMALTGSRPAVIEVEYEYEELDGDKIRETDSFPVKLLSRNEVVFSSYEQDEVTGYHDMFDFGPALMTAFTTPGDPVIQQLAGRVSGVAAEAAGRPIAASASDEDCVMFLRAMWAFVNANRIAYQTPPGFMADGHFGQHIKYGRDVLQNRAGTCVDLAITWASVCEAVGLEPTIVLIPGHAYPAVKLPESGRLLALESTAIGQTFDTALEAGMQNLNELEETAHYQINITEMRASGIVPLDLPNVDQTFLNDLDYSFDLVRHNPVQTPSDEATPASTHSSKSAPDAGSAREPNTKKGSTSTESASVNIHPDDFVPNGSQVPVTSLVGAWYGSIRVDGVLEEVLLVLTGDAGMTVTYGYNRQDGTYDEEVYHGTWAVREGTMVIRVDGEEYVYDFRREGNMLYAGVTDHEAIIGMRKVER